MTLQQQASQRVLLLDGATGTMVRRYGLQAGNNDILSLTRPDIIRDIHRRYLEAGADIIETCTFNAQRISLADCGEENSVRAINRAAVLIAREEADRASTPDKPRFVAGSVGPTSKTLSMSPDVEDPAARAITFEELEAAYIEQMEVMVEGGVDAILIETIFDTLNAKAALSAATKAMATVGRTVPLMLSVTLSGNSGRTLSGQTLDAFLASVSTYDLFSVGLNCSFGPEQMAPFLRHLSAIAPCRVSCYPNAGLPDALGDYATTPEAWAASVKMFLDEGLVDIVGGCCGTTDDFIAALAPHVATATPRQRPAVSPSVRGFRLAGLEPLMDDGTPFVCVGERCNIAGSRRFLRLIREKNYDEALLIARHQVEDGACVIDIHLDDALLDTRAEMTHFLNLLASDPAVARVPFMIDSSDWNVIVAALGCIQGKAIVNSISLKEGEEPFLAHARDLRRLGAAVVVMAFDEQGQATTYERRIAICERAYRLLVDKVEMDPSDIIFDPNILAVATGIAEHNAYANEFIRAAGWIRQHLPGAHVSGGVSNLSFAFRGHNALREAMHAVFLHHATAAGLDMAIVNPSSKMTYDEVPQPLRDLLDDLILDRRPDAADRLTAYATADNEAQLQGPASAATATNSSATTTNSSATATNSSAAATNSSATTTNSSATTGTDQASVAARLTAAIVSGDESTLAADLTLALNQWPTPVAIIEGPLMSGMNRVGELFGDGRMFLPQVVRAARTMKSAVTHLQPYMAANNDSQDQTADAAPLVMLATVAGDVHDIGKNIVSIIMSCGGFRIVDLGVMVPAETIVERAAALHPDIIGLSGLITPSLSEMVTVARQLHEAGIDTPLLIGGATTSALHTALRIASVTDAPVVHVGDASQNCPVARQLLDAASRDNFVATLRTTQQQLRDQYAAESQSLLSLDEARDRRPHFFD